MNNDSAKTLLYVLGRIGLYIALSLFGLLVGSTFLAGIISTAGSFLAEFISTVFSIEPKLEFEIYENNVLLSFISWFIMACLLIAVYADDAKRHTAYRTYNPILIACTTILSSAIYYLPAVITRYLEPKEANWLKSIFYNFEWLVSISENVEIYAMIGSVISVVICIIPYLVARKIYLKKFESGEYEYQE